MSRNNAYDAVVNEEDKRVMIEVVENADCAQLAVVDSGRRIPEEAIDRIYEPFFTTKKSDENIGLGLSFSKIIVESHKGRLFLDTACQHTRFVIEVPRAQS